MLRATPERLLGDLETLGFLFESLCERDLKIYAESFGAKLYHYQDYAGKEIAAVIELPDGKWCAFEIKLGANQIDSDGVPPTVLCVICGLSNAAYQREDSVFVIPITALKN